MIAVSPGPVIWITGFSGAGKTTVSLATLARLKAAGRCCVLLDGDRLRATLAPDAGHSPGERLGLALTYSRLCRELSGQGLTVVCATISMFDEVWAWNRANIAKYLEVYLRVPLDVRATRDAKGLYGQKTSNMVGLDMVLPEPASPHLIIENHGAVNVNAAVDIIVDRASLLYQHL